MKKNKILLLGVGVCILTSCGTAHNSAPIIERVSDIKLNPDVRTQPSLAKASATTIEGAGNYIVKKGDTLFRIALDNGQNYRDIVAWNNLVNPNDIKVDQMLRVLPPEPNSDSAHATGVNATSAIEIKIVAAPVTVPKTSPRGDKRPYSESALEELQKNDVPAFSVAKDGTKTIDKSLILSAVNVKNAPEEMLSWIWPTNGKIVGAFDEGRNKGIDIAGKDGQQIAAAGAGKVIYAAAIRGYGNLVVVKHNSSLSSVYAHNKTILVKEGQNVSKGEIIAEMGNSDADAIQLHFEIRQQGKPVDPIKFLPAH